MAAGTESTKRAWLAGTGETGGEQAVARGDGWGEA